MYVALLLAALPGATITVNTLTDENNSNGVCSLREAIMSANDGSLAPSGCVAGTATVPDLIVLGVGTYALTGPSGDLDVTTPMVIQGVDPGMTVVDGSGLDRVFDVTDLGTDVFVLRNLSITGGMAPGGEEGGGIRTAGNLWLDQCAVFANRTAASLVPGSSYAGGGIFSTKLNGLLVSDSTIADNHTGDGDCNSGSVTSGSGAGIAMNGGRIVRSLFQQNIPGVSINVSCTVIPGGGGAINNTGGSLTIEQCHFTGNSANDGGALSVTNTSLVVRQSSFVSNHAEIAGTAIRTNTSPTNLSNLTISGNTGSVDTGALYVQNGNAFVDHATIVGNVGGGIEAFTSGQIFTKNSVIAGNSSITSAARDRSTSGGGNVQSNGYNVFSPTDTLPTNVLTDQRKSGVVGVGGYLDALAPLTDRTQYHPPFAGTPVIDGGTCTDNDDAQVVVDQLGRERRCGCDIGAIELQRPAVQITDEPAGPTNCTAGGKRIATLDCSGNVLATTYVCIPVATQGAQGAPGASGPTGAQGGPGIAGPQGLQGEPGTYVHTEKIASGDAECSEGGVRIFVGQDADGDGNLSGAEVSETQVVCTPPSPPRNGCNSTGAPTLYVLLLFLTLSARRRVNAFFLARLRDLSSRLSRR